MTSTEPDEREALIKGIQFADELYPLKRTTAEIIADLTLERIQTAKVQARICHASDLARAVGLLEGLGYPDRLLNDNFKKLESQLKAGEE